MNFKLPLSLNFCLQEVHCLLGEGLGWQVKLAAWPRWLKMSSRHQVNGRPSLKCRLWFWRKSREWRLAPVQMLGTPMTWRLYYLSYLFSTDLYSCLWPLVGCLVLKPRLHPSLLPLTFLLPVCVPLSIHARRLRLDWLAHSSTGSFCLVLDPSLYSEQFFEIFEIFSALSQFLCVFLLQCSGWKICCFISQPDLCYLEVLLVFVKISTCMLRTLELHFLLECKIMRVRSVYFSS